LRYPFYLIALVAGFGVGLFVFPSANDRPLVTGFDEPSSNRPTVLGADHGSGLRYRAD
jgi:hypothetical protein